MYRHSPSRNQRSKGIKVKHVLQILLLVAVCFWLIYQVKHSHDKKKEFDENEAKVTEDRGSQVKLGRKDLHPRVDEIAENVEKHDEGEDETAVEDEEENRHEEEEENNHEKEDKEDSKSEEKDDEGRGGGDDEIDEHDQDKTDSDEELIVDGKERDEVDEKESEERDSEESNGQIEIESEDNDHDGSDSNTHEAREEQYKADDASSAVTHDTQSSTTENERDSSENPIEHAFTHIAEQENKFNNTAETDDGPNKTELITHESEIAIGGGLLNATTGVSTDSVSSNSSLVEVSNDLPELGNNSEEGSAEPRKLSTNKLETTSELTRDEDRTIEGSVPNEVSNSSVVVSQQGNFSILAVNITLSDSNTLSKTEDLESTLGNLSNLTVSSNSTVSENLASSYVDSKADNSESLQAESNNAIESGKSDANNEAGRTGEGFGSSNTENPEDVHRDESGKSDANNEVGRTDEGSGSSNTENPEEVPHDESEKSEANNEAGRIEVFGSSNIENPEEVHHDPVDSSDSSIPLEERDVRTDLETLPDLHTEGTNSRDVAAE